ncbi:MAG: hypothetical protein Q8R92_00880 [Deltaproteobacteria bacterium]|nr:hypothetical protein [Deltaproteobacteria bacterium]
MKRAKPRPSWDRIFAAAVPNAVFAEIKKETGVTFTPRQKQGWRVAAHTHATGRLKTWPEWRSDFPGLQKIGSSPNCVGGLNV